MEFTDPAATFANAICTWVCEQRWAPRLDTPLRGLKLLTLCPTVHILLAQMGVDGTILQIPLVSKPAQDHNTSDILPIGVIDNETHLFDGTREPQFWQAWANLATVTLGTRDNLVQSATQVRSLNVEQSNTSVLLLGGHTPLLAKVFRILHGGVHPEVEIPTALTQNNWPGVPPVWAHWSFPDPNTTGLPMCSAVVSTVIQDAVDGSDYFVQLAKNGEDPFPESKRIGALTASLHNRLAHLFGEGESASVATLRNELRIAVTDAKTYGLDSHDASAVLNLIDLPGFLPEELTTETIRIHGDLHLGQLLRNSKDQWVTVDFEGEPLRDLKSRRRKSLAMRDVAGVLRSFDYAAVTDSNSNRAWVCAAREGFLKGYNQNRAITEEDKSVLEALELEKALYEITYEGRFRSHRLPIPISAIKRILNSN